MVTANKRREKDVMKLLVSEYEVTLTNEQSNSEFVVKFFGPKDSPYEGVSAIELTTVDFHDYLRMGEHRLSALPFIIFMRRHS